MARLDGDEFGVLLAGDTVPSDVEAFWQRLRELVHEPLVVDGVPVVVEATVGYATAEPWDSEGALLRRAFVTLAAAKRQRLGVLGYAPEYDGHDASALALVSQLGSAIAADQLLLHFQPKYDVRTEQVTSLRHSCAGSTPSRACCTLATSWMPSSRPS